MFIKKSHITTIGSISIMLGFIAGLFVSALHISSNRYIQYKMFRLIVLSVTESINKYVALSLLCVLVISCLLICLKILLRFFIMETFAFHIKNKKRLILLLFIVIALCLIWSMQKGILPSHPLSKKTLFYAASTLMASILFFWISTRDHLKVRLASFAKKNIIVFAALLLCIVGIMNLSMYIDSRTNIPQGPNVILVIVDTLRADHMGCYGYSRNTTSHIDELARNSLFFKNAIAPSPWTCPSISTFFTAQYPAHLGITETAINIQDGFLSLAEIFREYNYKTQGIISSIYIAGKYGYAQGFDGYDEDSPNGEHDVSSPAVTQKAVSFIRKNRGNKFFLFLHYFDPHYAYRQHQDYNYYPDYKGFLSSDMDINDLWFKAPLMSADDLAYIKALYDSEIAFTDEYIGKFLDELKMLGLYDNALIIFTADHGEEFSERGDHYIGHTRKLFQEMLHVPLLIKPPNNNTKMVVDKNVGLIDLMPTIIKSANLTMPDQYRYAGQCIDVTSDDKSNGTLIISETRWKLNFQSAIAGDWKFIHLPEMGIRMLFNVKDDPAESRNIAVNNVQKAASLEAMLHSWNQEVYKTTETRGNQQTVFSEKERSRLKALGYLQ